MFNFAPGAAQEPPSRPRPGKNFNFMYPKGMNITYLWNDEASREISEHRFIFVLGAAHSGANDAAHAHKTQAY